MADADEAKKPSLLHEMEGLRTEKAQAETAADLDAFAAGNERLGEWLTVSKQYLFFVVFFFLFFFFLCVFFFFF